MKVNKMIWVSWLLSVFGLLPFLMGVFMKFLRGPQMLEGWNHLGWPESMITVIAILEALCVALYLIPQVSVLGAVLLTGFLGGAISTHLRIGEPVVMHIVLGVFIWGGLYLREPRLREILPIRNPLA